MQFSIMTVFALAAVAIAMPTAKHNTVAKRQIVSDAIPANAPAMTDANGNVIPFVAKDVYVHPVGSKAK
ncbi:hypothetical protein MKX07_007116 [Trichoderma sp. CBMAI-0711]|uniref:Predicted protein n=3 Tax=Trichoderma TaxID=5543 RepID=G0RI26_HYPJQ|nr:uncharacterized protein TRIREDRAFT_107037 [Trichoderma reesei QM6a]ETS02410.1 hypothetical protein M419DRAFT_78366 [Trichoderma reesei RUT C-30]KAH0493024.1 hypothetical protein TgHK011_007947 [Trichoderma gracile]KAK1251637.1 hypothetical protein MKX07_007116 [Trichoderma sp. CBMAI-0711]OTA06450.1 hypothetical protein A9Z42_0071880 [Trichoderma parareesei]EGR48984.1 predicted protein [Trichoderma reesei QM6a]